MHSDSIITIFGSTLEDAHTTEERLAFLRGYHDALASSDPAKPQRIGVEREPPLGLEQHYRAGEAKAQNDLEEKSALTLDVALLGI